MHQFGAPNCYTIGADVLVLEVQPPHSRGKQAIVWRLHDAAQHWPGVIERVPGLNNFTIRFDPLATEPDALRERLLSSYAAASAQANESSRVHEIPVRYGCGEGPDLCELSEHLGLTQREIVELHCSREYRVYFLGFAPGFAYLGDLDPRLHLPRRSEPRTRVSAGSVAIAGSQTAIYPASLPGGWHLIGRTALRLFDPAKEPAALMQPGDRVRFVEVE